MIREATEAAIAPLREQLEHERARSERAERQIEALQTALADERRRLIAILTEAQVPWWRRWFR